MNLNKSKEQIFKEVFFEYHKSLCNYAYQYVLDIDAAKDIVQDVFCELWLQIDKIDFSYPLNNLLYKYTKNKTLNYLAKTINSKKSDFKELSLDTYIKYLILDDVINEIHSKDLDKCIERGIDSLPPQCRSVFILSRKNGLKNKEIAQELEINIKTVEKHITKALLFLKKHLAENGFIETMLIVFLYSFFQN